MREKHKLGLIAAILAAVLLAVGAYVLSNDIAILSPKGTIAAEQRNLMVVATLLMLIVVVPVYIMTFVIAWKYRIGNKKARYTPDWDGNKAVETLWWGVPLAIIVVLAGITWKSSHDLDPFRPINASAQPITIRVVALQWKWLFIYPEENIATVNYIQIPKDTPVNFEITSDAPMNSFWIPQLGGQVYAMAGMKTQLHLIANEEGSYAGSSANLSGKGFAGMKFTADAVSTDEYKHWVQSIQVSSSNVLNDEEYKKLAVPSENNIVSYYSRTDRDLYNNVIMKYMAPRYDESTETANTEHGH